MANHKSAVKRTRQNKKRRARNFAVRSQARTAVKKAREAIESGSKENAVEALRQATKILDSSVSKGVSHANNAARRISRLAKQINSMS